MSFPRRGAALLALWGAALLASWSPGPAERSPPVPLHQFVFRCAAVTECEGYHAPTGKMRSFWTVKLVAVSPPPGDPHHKNYRHWDNGHGVSGELVLTRMAGHRFKVGQVYNLDLLSDEGD